MAEKIEQLVEEIGKMPVMELAKLVKALEDTFGVSAAMPAAAPVAAVIAAETAEKTEFKVTLKSVGSEKIKVIKAIRSVTSLGLKEAKELVDSAPSVVVESASKDDANEMKKKFEEAGATVELS